MSTLVAAPQAAAQSYQARQRLLLTLLAALRRQWALMDGSFDAAWASISPTLLLLLSAAQLRAILEAEAYLLYAASQLEAPVDPPVGRVNAYAFRGLASDGRPLSSLLDSVVVRAKSVVAGGGTVPEALAAGGRTLDLIATTQLADAARNGESVAMTATKQLTGYTRMLNPPSCDRCIILAGKWFAWNEGFLRHPRCDCFHIPSAHTGPVAPTSLDPNQYFDSLTREQQDAAFGAANAQAIRDGADIFRVVNVQRSTYVASGQRQATPAGRPMPEWIYWKAAGDRDQAIAMLHQYGYLT